MAVNILDRGQVRIRGRRDTLAHVGTLLKIGDDRELGGGLSALFYTELNPSGFKAELATLGPVTSHSLVYHWYFRPDETVSVLGSSILAIPNEADLRAVQSELGAYASTLPRDGENFVMNVGADVVEIRKARRKIRGRGWTI